MTQDERTAAVLRKYGLEPDPVIEFYKRDVDRSRLRQNLERTTDERMALLVEMQRLHERRDAQARNCGARNDRLRASAARTERRRSSARD